jgi:hypothetical protein
MAFVHDDQIGLRQVDLEAAHGGAMLNDAPIEPAEGAVEFRGLAPTSRCSRKPPRRLRANANPNL